MKKSRVGWWIAAAVCLHILVWVWWFSFAARHPVREVPLATAPKGP
jgi:hypothetical protein